jgi:hypothetical protein
MRDPRVVALRRFGIAITTLNVVGRAWLGIESSWLALATCVLTAYALEGLLLAVDRLALGLPLRRPRPAATVDYLLPAHIAAMATSMLLYTGDRLLPLAFAVAAGVCSKRLVRVRVGAGTRHVLNPSNAGIAVTLLLFPAVGMAPPYQFTEALHGAASWLPLAVITATGTLVNSRLTRRGPLILGWLAGFLLQAAVRAALGAAVLAAAVAPMTGTAFVLYTFYMVTDPGTTPVAPSRQVAFGLSTAAAYGLLVAAHVPYGLFLALTLTCAARGGLLLIWGLTNPTNPDNLPQPLRVDRDSCRPARVGLGEGSCAP